MSPRAAAVAVPTDAELAAMLEGLTDAERDEVVGSLPPAHQQALAVAGAIADFREFVRQAWHLVPQCSELVWGWHLDALCLHYEAVARGWIPDLLTEIPPGHAKSVIMAVLWPAWVWAWWPECQFIFGSYAKDLSERDSVRCRAVIESEWYRVNFSGPAGWRLRHDQNRKDRFANTRGGERMATSVGGGATGERAHIIAVDDPLNALDATSKAKREEVKTWLSQTLQTRWVDAKVRRFCMVMQRLHPDDPAAWMIANTEHLAHLSLPGEFVVDRRAVTHTLEDGVEVEYWRDPREVEGELLFEEKFPRAVLDQLKVTLGAAGYSAQVQQDPKPPGGGMFKRKWWRFWKPDGVKPEELGDRPLGCADLAEAPARALPPAADADGDMIIVDANFKKKEGADPVSVLVIRWRGALRFVIDRRAGPIGFIGTVAAIRELKALYPSISKVLIENKANGDAIIEALQEEIAGVLPVEPHGGKEARANSIQPQVQAGTCYLPEGAPWLEDWVFQFEVFPKGSHDDDVDAFSHALRDITFGDTSTAQQWAQADF